MMSLCTASGRAPTPRPRTRFTLAQDSDATGPPERRGVARDGVRMLVARPDRLDHLLFHDLPGQLDPGDLVVVNTSATVPAALDAHRHDGRRAVVHVSTRMPGGAWVVELRRLDGAGPELDTTTGERLRLPGGLTLRLGALYPDPTAETGRLRLAEPTPTVPLLDYLARHGRPIGYRHLTGRYPLADHQTVYATQPGSAEMASAGRPFTATLLVRLMTAGVTVAPIVLHAGVSSPELGEPPSPERFDVPHDTARLVNSARAAGRRVVAVGTTVVRALESAAGVDATVRAASGWTDLVIGPDRPVRVVSGLVTGLHAPEASHLLLLEAVAGPDTVAAAYDAAVQHHYLWHEFGDSTLFLP
ncbi:MAG: S-adenosylmethionine:tRNA ribosyltransferase-isomerase [Pseudonocardiaceae bacterium]